MTLPMSFFIAKNYNNDPFLILINCLLSLRARDVTVFPVSEKLFAKARSPRELLKIPIHDLEKLLKPLGFFRQKSKTLHNVSRGLLERFGGKVPANEQDLLLLKGVGRKTANLVLGVAFQIPAICVDTHVHRLANQLGLVTTKTPEGTERELKKIVPKKDWIELNKLLVMWGQQVPRRTQIPRLEALLNYKSTGKFPVPL